MKKLLTLILYIQFSITLADCQRQAEIQKIELSETLYTPMDSILCKNILDKISNNPTKKFSNSSTMIAIAQNFFYSSYRKNQISNIKEEMLIVDFKEFDCVTLVETTMAISLTLQQKKNDFYSFLENLKKIRYKDGILNGYCSRLHYFSDWIKNNEEKGLLQDITQSLGGIEETKTVNYMSNHRKKYAPLYNLKNLEEIKKQENNISRYKRYYLPKNRVEKLENKIDNSDIIAITTSIAGLDITHVGFAIHHNGRLHLLHASSVSNKVFISPKPLSEYLSQNKYQTGIRVLRLNMW